MEDVIAQPDLEFEWTYCGDGVYLKYDGFGWTIHANSHDKPTDRIYLEPHVFSNMKEYMSACAHKVKMHNLKKKEKKEGHYGPPELA